MTIVPNLFFIVVGAGMLWQILIAPPGRLPQPGDPGPWLLPTALAVLMIVLGCAELWRGMRRKEVQLSESTLEAIKSERREQDAAGVETLAPPKWPARIVFVVALLAYVMLFARLGFTLSTFAFLLVAVTALTGPTLRGIGFAAVIGAVASLCIGWLLAGVVGVPLPGVLLLP